MGGRFTKRARIMRFVNAFDRTVDELVVYLRARGLYGNTVTLYITDNGSVGPREKTCTT